MCHFHLSKVYLLSFIFHREFHSVIHNEYIFYINGVESARSSFGNGVSTIPEEVIVSLELPGSADFEKDYSTQMVIDYVKIYQK